MEKRKLRLIVDIADGNNNSLLPPDAFNTLEMPLDAESELTGIELTAILHSIKAMSGRFCLNAHLSHLFPAPPGTHALGLNKNVVHRCAERFAEFHFRHTQIVRPRTSGE